MQNTDTAIFLQSLRGNQALVILAFLVIRTAMTIEHLQEVTGLNDDTLRSALKGLKGKGLLFMQRGEHGRQTWIPVSGTFFARLFDQNPKTSDSALVVVNVESEESKLLYSTTLTNKAQNPKTSDSDAEPDYWMHLPKPIEDIRQCMALLRSAGIVGRKAREIAEDHHITADMIKAHLAWVKTEEWQSPTGMVIYRLQNHVEPPELNELGHVVECRCEECRSLRTAKRYTDGAFSKLVNGRNETEESEEQ